MTNKNPRRYRFLKYLIANYGSCLNDHVPWSKRNTITKLISFIGISLFQFVALMKCVCICIVITVCQFVGFPNNRYGSGSFVSQATIGGTVTNAFIDLTNFTSITLLSYLRLCFKSDWNTFFTLARVCWNGAETFEYTWVYIRG